MHNLSKYNTYIEKWNITNRWCYNFSYQIRKIIAYLWWEVQVVSNYEDAKIAILISCIVVPEQIKENCRYIDNFLKNKKKVIFYGCFSNIIKKEIEEKYWDKISIITHESENDFSKIYKNIKRNFKNSWESNFSEKNIADIFSDYATSNYHLVVGKWCKHNCSFCVIREWKKIESFQIEDIMKSFKKKYKLGIRHFRITSDDLSTYWVENKISLFELIYKIIDYDEDITLELWPIYPWFILENRDKFWKLFKTWKIKELLSAIQHRESRILRMMNRWDYDNTEFENFLTKVKSTFPEIGLSTHLIYCFPTETHREFLNNLKGIKIFDNIQFHRFRKTYKMKDIIFDTLDYSTIDNRINIIRKLFSNRKWLLLEEDISKIVVIKKKNDKKTSFVEKYF